MACVVGISIRKDLHAISDVTTYSTANARMLESGPFSSCYYGSCTFFSRRGHEMLGLELFGLLLRKSVCIDLISYDLIYDVLCSRQCRRLQQEHIAVEASIQGTVDRRIVN